MVSGGSNSAALAAASSLSGPSHPYHHCITVSVAVLLHHPPEPLPAVRWQPSAGNQLLDCDHDWPAARARHPLSPPDEPVFRLPKQLRTQTAPWPAPVRRNHVALAHTVIHFTLRRTHIVKQETEHAGPPGIQGLRGCHLVLQHTSAITSASAVRLISAVRMISDDRLSELWSIYKCAYSAGCARIVEIVQPPLTPVGTGRRPDGLLLHEKACVLLLAWLLDTLQAARTVGSQAFAAEAQCAVTCEPFHKHQCLLYRHMYRHMLTAP
eukprot:jgi/Astpho2/2953/Aster-01095